jgi:hypothetical protein
MADHVTVHADTVSRRLKQAERPNVSVQDLTILDQIP